MAVIKAADRVSLLIIKLKAWLLNLHVVSTLMNILLLGSYEHTKGTISLALLR